MNTPETSSQTELLAEIRSDPARPIRSIQAAGFTCTHQLAYHESGGVVYSDEELVAAAGRDRQGKASEEDLLQLGLLRPGQVKALLECHDFERAERRRAEEEIRVHGPDVALAFHRDTGQLDEFRRLGVRYRPLSLGRRAPRSCGTRRRGSRRRAASRSAGGGDPDDGSDEPPGGRHQLDLAQFGGDR